MALKSFLIYICSFLSFSVLLAVVVNKLAEGFAESGRKPYIYGSFSAVVAALIAFLATLFSGNLFQVFWFLCGIFLLFGMLHVRYTNSRYFYVNRGSNTRVFMGELAFAMAIVLFTIVVFSSLQYFLKEDKFFLFYPVLMSTLVFFVPMLTLHTFEAAYAIPPAEFVTWQYPHAPIDLPEENPKERLLVIGFLVAKKAADREQTYFRAKAPEGMKLGELYYHFVNDYNDLHSETVIEFADGGSGAHEWWFRRKPKWYEWERILNPDLSVRENGIKENMVIICERMHHSVTVDGTRTIKKPVVNRIS